MLPHAREMAVRRRGYCPCGLGSALSDALRASTTTNPAPKQTSVDCPQRDWRLSLNTSTRATASEQEPSLPALVMWRGHTIE